MSTTINYCGRNFSVVSKFTNIDNLISVDKYCVETILRLNLGFDFRICRTYDDNRCYYVLQASNALYDHRNSYHSVCLLPTHELLDIDPVFQKFGTDSKGMIRL